MFNFDLNDMFSFFMSMPYTFDKDTVLNYSNAPRPYNNITLMKEGCATIESDGNTLSFNEGDVLFIPQNTTYNSVWHCKNKLSFHTLHFSFNENCNPFKQKNIPVQRLDNCAFSILLQLFNQIKDTQNSQDEKTFSTVSNFFKVCKIITPLIKTLPPKPTTKVIIPAIEYLENNFNKPVTIEHLASLCFLSPSRFYFLFKKHTGFSPIVYKNQLAITKASRELISNKDESILDIANANGFTSLIYFERLFKKITGKSPSEYRKTKLFL